MSDPNERLIMPVLGCIYEPLGYLVVPLLRVATGAFLFAHGWPKLATMPETAGFLESAGYTPGMLWAVLLAATELVGGLFLALGFLTRLVSVPIFIFVLNAVMFHRPNGFYWNSPNGGWEYPLMLTIIALFFFAKGAGPLSVDSRLNRVI
jgi:putative oxidoreductase